jgi:hypothetical protein
MSKSMQDARPRPADSTGDHNDLTDQIRQANAELGAAVRDLDRTRRGGRSGKVALVAGVTCAIAVGVLVLRRRAKR